MTWNKTWLGYILWGIYTVFTVVLFLTIGIEMINNFELPYYFMAFPIIVILLFYFLIKYLKKRIFLKQLSKSLLITLEGLIFVGLLSGGLLVRLYSIQDLSKAEVFQLASITGNIDHSINSYGALGVYIVLLKTMFYYIGNSWLAAAILQILIQLISFIFLYFIVRKTSGAIAAIFSNGFLMFSPEIVKCSVGLYPSVFFLFLCIIMIYFLTESNQAILENGKVKTYQLFAAFLIGLPCGVITYLDIHGLMILILGLSYVLLVSKENIGIRIKNRPLYVILLTLGILIGFLAAVMFSSLGSESGVLLYLIEWEKLFTPILGQPLYNIPALNFSIGSIIYLSCLTVALLIGCLGFWETKTLSPQFGWFLLAIFSVFLQYNCIAENSMNRLYFIAVILAVLGGCGFETLFTKEQVVKEEMIEMVMETETEIKSESDSVDTIEVGSEEKQVQFIPNPLPLPKKHVKKTMGYGIEISEVDMKYDIEIPEDDDFDI